MFRYVIPVALFSAFLIFFAIRLKQEQAPLPSALIGRPLPAFQLSDVLNSNETVTDKTLHGKVVLLNVWATWCPSCLEEHAFLIKIKSPLTPIFQRGEGGISIYGLNYKDDRANAQEWLKKYGNPYEMSAFDEDGRVAIELGVYGTPETFILDKQGIIRYRHVGPINQDVWEKTLWLLVQELS